MPRAKTQNVSDPTMQEAALEVNASVKFIRARIAAGDLEAYRLKGSRLIRIRRDSLDELKRPLGGDAA